MAAQLLPLASGLEQSLRQFAHSAMTSAAYQHRIRPLPHRCTCIRRSHKQTHNRAGGEIIEIVSDKSCLCLRHPQLTL